MTIGGIGDNQIDTYHTTILHTYSVFHLLERGTEGSRVALPSFY